MTMMPNSAHQSPAVAGRWLGGAIVAASLMLSGCVTGGYPGGTGGYPGSGGYPPSQGTYPGSGYPTGSQRLLGTVEDIDPHQGRLMMSADAGGYGSSGYGSSRVEVYFDGNTQLVYQGRVQAVEGLERGDRIDVEATQAQGRLWARRIEVVQNVREGTGSAYGGQLQGAVSAVDPGRRLITITQGGYSGRREQVYYDERTRVDYRGQSFRPEQLDQGDVVRVQARRIGNDWLAEQIWVEVDARSR
jgi:hypothetical protein